MHAGSQLCVHATRPIAAGEALTISYVDLLSPPISRQCALLQSYGFLCSCTRCCAPATAAVGHACLWTVRGQPCSSSGAAPPWQLVPSEGPLQAILAAESGVEGVGAAVGAADGGEDGGAWECCPALREAAHAMHNVSQVLQTQDLQPPMLQALKRRLNVRPPAP